MSWRGSPARWDFTEADRQEEGATGQEPGLRPEPCYGGRGVALRPEAGSSRRKTRPRRFGPDLVFERQAEECAGRGGASRSAS